MSFVGSSTETYRNGEFLVTELPGYLSRDQVTVKAVNDAATTYNTGKVLGQITIGTITSAAGGGNTGTGTIGSITAGSRTKVGAYVAKCFSVTGGYFFQITNPNGVSVGIAQAGVAFVNAELNFTISDTSTHFVIGDTFTVTVAAGSGKYTAFAPTAVDGSQNASAILYDKTYMGGSSDIKRAVVNAWAEVSDTILDWGSASSPQKVVGTAQLLALGIKVRVSV